MWAAAMSTTRKLSLMSGKKAESSSDQRCLHTKRGLERESAGKCENVHGNELMANAVCKEEV